MADVVSTSTKVVRAPFGNKRCLIVSSTIAGNDGYIRAGNGTMRFATVRGASQDTNLSVVRNSEASTDADPGTIQGSVAFTGVPATGLHFVVVGN
jgi:hypothetical protein